MGGRKSEYCAVKGCRVNKKNFESARFFLFPKKLTALKRWNDWVRASRHTEECIAKRKKNFVCCAHFERRAFINTLLKKNAVPELLLDQPISESSLQNLTNCTCGEINKQNTETTRYSSTTTANKKSHITKKETPDLILNDKMSESSMQSLSCDTNTNLDTSTTFSLQYDDQLIDVQNTETFIIIHNPHLQ